jgi:hypothetical protein
MSEYQYYEFQAIDRPLDKPARNSLRALSSRARITSTSFINSYQWGDFKGDPDALMEEWFDLHLYLANWGSRRLTIRLPSRFVDKSAVERFVGESEGTTVRTAGENLILDIQRDETDADWEDGPGWLTALAPLRADLLLGDHRVLYLLWLMGVEDDVFPEDTPEPMPGLGPMTDALEAFATFFGIGSDLVLAAAERPAIGRDAVSPDDARNVISKLTDHEKTGLLTRLFEGDPHTGTELSTMVRRRVTEAANAQTIPPRTVSDLLARADAIGEARERKAAEQEAAERVRLAKEAAEQQRERLDAIARRGEGVWHDVEAEIVRGNGAAYNKAADLLLDLRTVAEQRDSLPQFTHRLLAIRERHARKPRFLARLAALE